MKDRSEKFSPEWDSNPVLCSALPVERPGQLGSWSLYGSMTSPLILDICNQVNEISFGLWIETMSIYITLTLFLSAVQMK